MARIMPFDPAMWARVFQPAVVNQHYYLADADEAVALWPCPCRFGMGQEANGAEDLSAILGKQERSIMPTTYEVIFLGTLSNIDTLEGNEVAENAAGILGTYGTSTTPLSGQVRTLSSNSLSFDDSTAYDANNLFFGYDSFRINGGAAQNFDSVTTYNATITYADGTTAAISAVVFQDVNGNTYLAPELTNNSDQVALTAKPIMSLTLTSVVSNTGDLGADRVAGDFVSLVDGTSNADTMNVGYVDAQGDRVSDGNDSIVAGAGNDTVNAGGGNDTVLGGTGADSVFGGAGADSIDGGDGNDIIGNWGSDDGNDTMRGGAGNDSIIGGTGDDLIFGDNGDDTLFGGAGNDTIFGGTGNDQVGITDDHNGDVYDLGEGVGDQDSVWFSNFISTNAVSVTFTGSDAASYAFSGGLASGSFSGAEIVGGTAYSDTLNAAADTDGQVLFGQSGVDSITGGSGNDTLYGGADADWISSGAGADLIDGGDGSDTIFFGTGGDMVFGGAGDDLIDDVNFTQEGAFNDYIDGGDGNDTIYTGGGNDTILGGAGNDFAYGDDGNDSIDGGAGNDSFFGGNGNDTLIGGAGADTIQGEAGDDVIDLTASDFTADIAFGGDGNDLIISRTDLDGGSDSLYGGDGRDTLVGGAGDLIDGGSTGDDVDTLDLSSAPVTATTTFTFSGTGAGIVINSGQTVTFTEIEVIRATEGADSINATVDSGGMVIDAGAGNDSVFGGSGRDSFAGGLGNDSMLGGAGNDTLDGGAGDDRLFGGDGADVLIGGAGADSLLGGNDADTIFGAAGDTVSGGESGVDSDKLVLNWANVQSVAYAGGGEAGTVTFTAASGGGTLTFSEIETIGYTGAIEGGAGNDLVGAGFGDAEGDQIDGVDGLNDTVLAGAGNDTVMAGAGNDLVFGGTGNDALFGGDGADTLDGGDGNDTLSGGAGSDTAVFTGAVTDYSFAFGAGNGLFVTDSVAGRDGVDLLDGVEFASFNGVTYRVIAGDDGANTTLQGPNDGTPSLIIAHAGNDWGGGHATSDVVFGGAGNDTLDGGDGNDTLVGEADDDLLRGDGGNDALFGGTGNDTLQGGAGNDTLTSGDGADVIELSNGGGTDLLADFDMTLVDGRTVDRLDVTDLLNAQDDPITWRDIAISDTAGDGSGDAVLTFPGGEQVILEGVTVQQAMGKAGLYAMGIPCYVAGTPILTAEGWCPVERLVAGQRVMTEQGLRRIIWAGKRVLSDEDLDLRPDWKPVHFPVGAIGNTRAIRLSPQHAVRMRDAEGRAVLVRARHLAESGFGGSRVACGVRHVSYHHVLLERHGVMNAAGAATESFYPGRLALEMLDWPSRLQVVAAIMAGSGLEVAGTEAAAALIYGARVHPLIGRWAQVGMTCPPFGVPRLEAIGDDRELVALMGRL